MSIVNRTNQRFRGFFLPSSRWGLVATVAVSILVGQLSIMEPRHAHAQAENVEAVPPQVILWGIQRGCDSDVASERKVIERLESYGGTPVLRMRLPVDLQHLNCVGVQCAQLVWEACPTLTGQLVGGEVDEVTSFKGAAPEPVVRLRVWRHDLSNKRNYYLYGLCPRGVCGNLSVQDKLADMVGHIVERQPFEEDPQPLERILDSRLPLCAMSPTLPILPAGTLDLRPPAAPVDPCRPFPALRCSISEFSHVRGSATQRQKNRSTGDLSLSRSVVKGTEGAVWGLFGTSAIAAVMLFALNGSSLATVQTPNYDVQGTFFRPAWTAAGFSLAALTVAIPTTYFLERAAPSSPALDSGQAGVLSCPSQ